MVSVESDFPGVSAAAAERNGVARVVAVLDALARADEKGVGVRELAAETGISRSAVHRLLAQLVELGYADVLPADRYEAGPHALAWAALLTSAYGVADAVRDEIDALAARFDETVYAVRYAADTQSIVFVAAAHSTQSVRYMLALDSHAPLHAGAAGKAVLAYLPAAVVDELDLVAHTDSTIVGLDQLRADMAETRRRGYAFSVGERIADAVGVAAPVFRDGEVAGAITLTIPRYRFRPELRKEYAVAVIAAAEEGSRMLSARTHRRLELAD